VIVPYLRGYGTTRFLADTTFRNGEPAALAVDIVALMDALKIERARLAGFDWVREPPTSLRLFGLSGAKRWCL
jgi:pimeloyl-ACP methyl ester carboxylesterase